MKHLTFQEIIEYLKDNIPQEKRTDITSHLKLCTQCQAELVLAQKTADALQPDILVAPTSKLKRQALAAFQRKKRQKQNLSISRATLEYDSRTRNVAMGMRGGGQADHQLLYSASDGRYDVDFQIAKDNTDTYILRGQIMTGAGPELDLEGLELRCTNADGVERRGLTDKLGRFTFSRLPESIYAIQITFDDSVVLFESVEIKH